MVSCLMGDSTALASAIVRCCLKKNKIVGIALGIAVLIILPWALMWV